MSTTAAPKRGPGRPRKHPRVKHTVLQAVGRKKEILKELKAKVSGNKSVKTASSRNTKLRDTGHTNTENGQSTGMLDIGMDWNRWQILMKQEDMNNEEFAKQLLDLWYDFHQ